MYLNAYALAAIFGAVLIISGCTSTPMYVHAIDLVTNQMVVTDHKGKTEQLTKGYLGLTTTKLGTEYRWAESFVELQFPGTPSRRQWIHKGHIRELVFDGEQVKVTTTDGSNFKGKLPPNALRSIEGHVDLGEILFERSSVHAIELIDFRDGESIIKTDAFRKQIESNRRSLQSTGCYRKCVVRDGKDILVTGYGISLRDSYDSNYRRDFTGTALALYDSQTFRNANFSRQIELITPAGEEKIDLCEINRLTLVEPASGRNLEASIEMRGGRTVRGPTRLRHSEAYKGPIKFFGVDDDDSLVVETSFGFESVSLLTPNSISVDCDRVDW